MDAYVSLRLTPGELDTLREALDTLAEVRHAEYKDAQLGPRERQTAQRQEAQARDLRRNL